MEESHHLSSSPSQQDSWTCQRCGWVYPNAHPSAKHRKNHKKHCGNIKRFEQHPELHKGGSSNEVSSDDDKETAQHQHDDQHNGNTPIEAKIKFMTEERPHAHQTREIPLSENSRNVIKQEKPVLATTLDALGVELKPPNFHTQNVHTADDVKSECFAAEKQSTDPRSETAEISAGDERHKMKITEFDCPPAKNAPSEALQASEHMGFVPEYSGVTGSDSSGLLLDEVKCAPESKHLLENASLRHAGSVPPGDELARINEKEDMPSYQQRFGDPDKDSLKQVAGSGQLKEIQKEENIINPDERSISHQATENISSTDKPSMAKEDKHSKTLTLPMDTTDEHLKSSQAPDFEQVKGMQKRESMDHMECRINIQSSSQVSDSWTCHRCGWVYPNRHPSAKHRRNHKKHCSKVKGVHMEIVPHGGGSSDEVSSDEENEEQPHHKKSSAVEVHNTCNGLTATDSATSFTDETGGLAAEVSLPAPGEEETLGSVHQTNTFPNDLDEHGVLQQQSKIPPIQEISSEGRSTILPLSAQRKELNHPRQDVSSCDIESSAANETWHKREGDCGPNVDRSLLSCDLQSDGFPPADAASSEHEGPSEGAFLAPITHPTASVAANKNLMSSEPTTAQQTDRPRESKDDSEDLEPSKESNSAGVSIECKSPNDMLTVLEPGNMISSGSVLMNDTGFPLDSVSSGTERTRLECDVKSGTNAEDGQANSYPDNSLASEFSSNIVIGRSENADWSCNQKIETPKVAHTPVQSMDSTSVWENVSGKQTSPENKKEAEPCDCNVTTAFIRDNSVIPCTSPLESNEGTLATNATEKVASNVDGVQEETSTKQIFDRPQVQELTEQSLASMQMEDRTAKSAALELDDRSSIANMESTSMSIPERESSGFVGSMSPQSTAVNMKDDSELSGLSDMNDLNQLSLATEGSEAGGSSVLLDNKLTGPVGGMGIDSGLPTSSKEGDSNQLYSAKKDEEHSIGEASAPLESLQHQQMMEPSEKPEKAGLGCLSNDLQHSGLAVDSHKLSDSGLPTSSKESGSNQLSLVKEHSFGEENALSGSLQEQLVMEPLGKPEIAGLGLSDRSLSNLSQHSDLEAKSHKLSDSLEIFEDAADTLDACSVGGSVEEGEGLDEPCHQVSGGVEVPKLLEVGPSDQKNDNKPIIMNGTSDLPKDKLNIVETREASAEEKSRPTNYSFSSRTEELRAPSPEAWQEPGPSTLKKEVEVMEDGKSSDSHTALRRLMAEEERGKVNQAVAKASVAEDVKPLDANAASANGMRPKSKSRSFWSNCICCPAVH